MGMVGGVNTTMKDKHLNLENAACQHNGQPPAPQYGSSAYGVRAPPPTPVQAARRSRGGVEAGFQ